ncbi:MAG: tyrosine-protein phosphatase [Dehalococcoidia bacterium]|nr:tyrosine-protein phosphatase [Dehalococcoidia bacterium]
MTTLLEERELEVEVAHNVRHLAGYETRHGSRTHARDIIRSASLHRLTENGIGTLYDTGVRTVVDFRSDQEREREATPDMGRWGIKNVHAPVFNGDASPAGLARDSFPGYSHVYRRFLDIGADAYRTLFETVADAEGAVVFHCAAGKDRTGVAAALLLDLGGATDDAIVADYRHTETLLKPLIPEWLPKMQERGINEERAHQLLAAPEEAIRTALETVREQHGGAEGYLRHLGLSTTAISAVRARIAE